MKQVKLGLCSALLLLCFVMSFYLANQTENFYNTVSLRYHDGILEEAVENVMEYLQTEEADKEINITFWKEEQGTVSTYAKELDTSVIRFSGNGEFAYYVNFLKGGYPLTDDSDGAAISDHLAWELFGSNDIVGQQFTYEEKTYTVRGVFKEKSELLIMAGDNGSDYSALELIGNLGDNEHQTSVDFAMDSGLEAPTEIVFGTSITKMLSAICYLPLIVSLLIMSAMVVKNLQEKSAVTKESVFFILLMILAVSSPFILANIPQWLLPTQWSDFSFWQNLLDTINLRIEEWFSLTPMIKDVYLKMTMLKISCLVIIELLLSCLLFKRLR